MSFKQKKFLILMKFGFLLYSFMDRVLGIRLKKLASKVFLLCLLLEVLRVCLFVFTCRSMIHFELILKYDVIYRLESIFYVWISSCSGTIC